MFYNFNKESLFFLNSFGSTSSQKRTEKKKFNLEYFSEFLSHLFFLTYYLDISQCHSIVFLDELKYNIAVLQKLFPKLKFYYSQLDLKYLVENDIKFVIICNNEMNFQEKLVKKYDPFMALLNFNLDYNKKIQYLDGVLVRKIFSSDNSAKLVVRGISYKNWENITIPDFSDRNYINPISNDNKTIYKKRGFYNSFDETATISVIIDYLVKINLEINLENVIKLLIYILDNLVEGKKINLDIEYLLN